MAKWQSDDMMAFIGLVLALTTQMSSLESARQCIAMEQLDTAIPILEGYFGANMESTEARSLLVYALQARAKKAFTAGALTKSLRDLNRAGQIEPGNSNIVKGLISVYTATGNSLLAKGDTEGAEGAYRRALDFDTTRRDVMRALASIILTRGKAHDNAGRYLEAISDYRRALEIDTRFIEAHLLIGQLYYAREEFALAQHHLRLARELTTTAIVGLDALLAKVDREFEVTRQYQTMEMDGFLVRFEGGQRPDLFYQVLPLLQEARDRATRLLERTVHQPLTVIIYAGEGFHRAIDAPDWAAGLFDGKIRLREAELSQPPKYLAQIIRHEVGHAVIEELAPGRVPAWVHEGIAKYLEIDRWDPLQDAAYLLAAIHGKRTVNLATMNQPFARMAPGTDVRLAYAQAAAAVRYLGSMQGERSLADIVALMAAGRTIEKALDSVTFYDLDTFQKRVNDWVVWEYERKI